MGVGKLVKPRAGATRFGWEDFIEDIDNNSEKLELAGGLGPNDNPWAKRALLSAKGLVTLLEGVIGDTGG